MCIDDQMLNTYLDGELAEPWRTQVEEHLSYCQVCKSRFDSLAKVKKTVQTSGLTDGEISDSKAKVLRFLEQNYLEKKQKVTFMKKRVSISAPAFVAFAAAFVIVFVGALFVAGGNGKSVSEQLVPGRLVSLDERNVTQVRATDNSTTGKALESYSLEDILKNLDARGYDVDIRLKGIVPIDETSSTASAAGNNY